MTGKYAKSERLFQEAKALLPGGVNSPVRAFKAVAANPLFITRGEGAYIYDADGNRYIDYVGSWGPLILGHRHPQVMAALKRCINETGVSFGAPTEMETELAGIISAAMPSVEMVRLVNSGTEAVMSAVRLARGYPKKDKIVKFTGCYHGHADSLLIKAGSGALTLGVPDSPGVTPGAAADTISADYNDLDGLSEIFLREGENIAAVIVEPVAGNMGVVPPTPEFLPGLRRLTREYGSLLIFDEVMTGFRVAYGGAQQLFGVTPDITCLGKVIGGGLPVGAYGGKRDIMENVAPLGPVYQAGTLSGNPLAVTAGITTLRLLSQPGVYEGLETKAAQMTAGLQEAARQAGVPVSFNRVASMSCVFFTGETVVDYSSATTSDTKRYAVYFKAMLDQGIYLAPSQYEAAFLSTAHTENDIAATLEAARKAFRIAADIS
ncbi:MAG: glutamate-1-semialdehyde 2,1-aminomutase [Peptococcaceae bacterium]|nr:glutamate-1-semialdehyde 2,1-aminomutase [Peptococcaceae bacterium]